MRFLWNLLLQVLAIAIALWVTVSLVPGITITPAPLEPGQPGIGATAEPASSPTFLAVAAVIVAVNAFIAPVLRVLGAPLTCLTLGLFSIVINGALLLISEFIFTHLLTNLGQFTIDGWWAAIFGAIVLGLASSVVNFFTSPLRVRG
ncbi:phage holin family protein [Corynebacterium lizhenjunii]|uniref:Phage holin family protein n=1 Tax=Corynebacterium lizhenjunii TaxID=2709394 RepID=A0A7T0PC26_9CORY|nr:phage holin family protein [Corynebacterium lizhenjunii]QPK79272.1 phage holin family protein [Corynebacterium lizhenjunii]